MTQFLSGRMPQRFPSQHPIAENRCATFFVSPVSPDSETDVRQQVIEHLMREIGRYDAEFRRARVDHRSWRRP
jgi:hypothetical protein